MMKGLALALLLGVAVTSACHPGPPRYGDPGSGALCEDMSCDDVPLPTREDDEQACEDGVQTACARLGVNLIRRGDGDEGLPLMVTACEWGISRACVIVSSYLREGQRVPMNLDESRRLLEKACNPSVRLGCNDLAGMIMRGEGGPPDRARTIEILEWVCADEPGVACVNLGRLLMKDGKDDPAVAERAKRLFERACSDGVLPGCDMLAMVFLVGPKALQDRPRGIELATQTCDRGHDKACAAPAMMLLLGDFGVTRDAERGFAFAERACNAGRQAGCAVLGCAYERGWGVRANPALGKDLQTKARTAGVKVRCEPKAAPEPTSEPAPPAPDPDPPAPIPAP